MSILGSLQSAFLRFHAALYQRTDGRVGHRLIGVPALILRSKGRRTGQPRSAVLTYAPDGADLLVVGSNDGGDRPPAWQLNVEADPSVEVQVGRRRSAARTRIVMPGEPDFERLWALVNRNNHGRYDAYQRRTSRPIPVVVVTPEEAGIA